MDHCERKTRKTTRWTPFACSGVCSQELLSTIEPPTNGSERILSLRLSIASGSVNLLTIYAPTLCSPPKVKDLSYKKKLHHPTASPTLITCYCWRTSMPGSVTTMIHGLPALDTMALGKWMKADNVCSSCALTTTSALPTHSTKSNPIRGSHGIILDPIAGISWTSSLPDVLPSTVCSTHVAFTVRTVTDHTLVCSKLKLRSKKIQHSKRKCRLCIKADFDLKVSQ